jgi:hypothetical protein
VGRGVVAREGVLGEEQADEEHVDAGAREGKRPPGPLCAWWRVVVWHCASGLPRGAHPRYRMSWAHDERARPLLLVVG